MYNICLSNSPFVPVEFCLWPLCKVCSHFEVQIFCILLFCLLDLPETELCWNLLCCWVFLLQPIVLDTFTLHIVRIYYHVQKLAYNIFLEGASLVAQLVKNPPEMWETWVWSLDWDDPLEEGMATHSSILAWRIPWAEESGGLQSMESHRVGHDWVTKHSTAQHSIFLENWHFLHINMYFGSVQSLSRVRLFATPWTAACQASTSITNS